jgi:hypothetical protein
MWRREFGSKYVAGFPEDFENEQYLLCPPRILGYATEQKLWAQFEVVSIQEVPALPKDPFDTQLELEETHKRIIKSLVKNHVGAGKDPENEQVRDIVPGKGKGLVILLHGKDNCCFNDLLHDLINWCRTAWSRKDSYSRNCCNGHGKATFLCRRC